MLCPLRRRRCKHALSAMAAAMYMYSVVQKSVAEGEDDDVEGMENIEGTDESVIDEPSLAEEEGEEEFEEGL